MRLAAASIAGLLLVVAAESNARPAGATLTADFSPAITLSAPVTDLLTGWFALPKLTVVGGGDINGDGPEDILVGDPDARVEGRGAAGRTFVIFGGSGPWAVTPPSLDGGGFAIVGPATGIEDDGVDGHSAGALAGLSVAAARDVNGDGLGDVLVGAPGTSPQRRVHAGSVFVVFGQRGTERRDLAIADAGLRIDGDVPEGMLGKEVSAAGDVNGDGLNDVLLALGGPEISPIRLEPGEPLAYVIFGRQDARTIDLRSLAPTDGYPILSPVGESDRVAVADAGDINGDSHPDALVNVASTGAFIVFGQSTGAAVDLRELGERGLSISNGPGRGWSAQAVPAGDVDGDRRQDLLLGPVHGADGHGDGDVAIVYGGPDPTPVFVERLGERGYRMTGGDFESYIAALGDINGDGLADALVSLPRSRHDRLTVVYGAHRAGPVNLRALGADGLAVRGDLGIYDDPVMYRAAGPGDLDGDGFGDILIGAAEYDRDCRVDLGAVYVIRGSRRRGTISAARLGDAGVRVEGSSAGAALGTFVAPAGDITGDGRPDALLGALPEEQYGYALHRFAGVLSGIPAGTPRADRPASSCARLRVLDRGVRRVLASGRLRVRIALRRLPPANPTVSVSVNPAFERFARLSSYVVPPSLSHVSLRLSRPGTRTVNLPVTVRLRRYLRSGPRPSISVTLGTESYELWRSTTVVLGP